MKKLIYFFILFIIIITVSSCGNKQSQSNNLQNSQNVSNNQTINNEQTGGNIAVITLSYGTIEIELDPINAPLTTANFKKLVNKKFYDGLTFHRVISGFVAQGGDPKGDGTGGSDETIQLEIKCVDGNMIIGKETDCTPILKHDMGVIAMARSSDPNSASSQFYITLDKQPSLDGKYAVFGKVIKGMDVVQQIQQGDVIQSIILK